MSDSALHTTKHQQKNAPATKSPAVLPDLAASDADWVIQLQRQIGNRAVTSMLAGAVQRDDDDMGIAGLHDREGTDEERAAKREQAQKDAEKRDGGLGQVEDETLEGASAMFEGAQNAYDQAEELRLLPSNTAALVERIEALKPKLKEARVRIITGLRDGMPRGWMESPGTLTPILAQIKKDNGDFPAEGTFDVYIERTKKINAPAQLRNATAAVDKMETALNMDMTSYVDAWLDAQGQATWDKFDALITEGNEAKILSAVAANYRKYTELGALRAYYRSKHDQEENATYGLSYDLNNTPLAVHLHSAGSGTIITAVSLKLRSDEYGQAVVFVKSISSKAPSLLANLVADIKAHGDSPRNVVQNIKNNGWRRRWTRSDVR
jgi:hypothetical protein